MHCKLWTAWGVLIALSCSREAGVNALLPWDRPLSLPEPQAPYGVYPEPSPSVPEAFILRNETTAAILERVATRKDKAIIYTTLRLPEEDTVGASTHSPALGMVSNFCYHLHQQDLLKHTMLITTDEATWRVLHDRGFPAYLDRAFPRRASYQASTLPPDTYNREWDVQKHWWGWRIVDLGRHRVLYLDSDAVVLGNALLPFQGGYYDVQGLSDWKVPELHQGMAAQQSCGLYAVAGEPRVGLGSMLREAFVLPPHEPRFATINPCQSTGVFFLEANVNNRTLDFMRALVDRIAYHAVWAWDQSSWNEVILAHCFGMGDAEPLRYRLLPTTSYSNIGVFRERRAAGMKVEPIILHLGYLHGAEKAAAYVEEGLYHPEFNLSQLWRVGGRGPAPGQPQYIRPAGWMVPVAALGLGIFIGRRGRYRFKGSEAGRNAVAMAGV